MGDTQKREKRYFFKKKTAQHFPPFRHIGLFFSKNIWTRKQHPRIKNSTELSLTCLGYCEIGGGGGGSRSDPENRNFEEGERGGGLKKERGRNAEEKEAPFTIFLSPHPFHPHTPDSPTHHPPFFLFLFLSFRSRALFPLYRLFCEEKGRGEKGNAYWHFADRPQDRRQKRAFFLFSSEGKKRNIEIPKERKKEVSLVKRH